MHWDTLKQDNYSAVRGDGVRVGEVRDGTTSPMPEHKGFFKLQLIIFMVQVRLSTVVEQATHVRVCAGSSRASIDHRKELI